MKMNRTHVRKGRFAAAMAGLCLAAALSAPAHAAPITEDEVLAKIERHATVTGNAGAEAKWRGVLALVFGGPGDAMSVADLEAQVARSQGQPWQAVWDGVWEAWEAKLAAQQQQDPPAQQDEQPEDQQQQPAAAPPVAAQDEQPQGFGSPQQQQDEQQDQQQQVLGQGQQDQVPQRPEPVEITVPDTGQKFNDESDIIKFLKDGRLEADVRDGGSADPLSNGRFSVCVDGSRSTCKLPREEPWKRGGALERDTEVRHRLGGVAGNDLWSVLRTGRDLYGDTRRYTVTDRGRYVRGGTVRRRSIDHETGQFRSTYVTHFVWYWEADPNGPETRTRTFFGENPATTPDRLSRNLTRRWVAAVHDGGNDYRAFGYWMTPAFKPRDGLDEWSVEMNSNNYLWPFAFAWGTNPAEDISGVTGTATYRGEAAGGAHAYNGVYDSQFTNWTGGTMVGFDQAPVTLTADFDANSMTGSIDMRGTWHPLDGYKGDGTRWIEDHLPVEITFDATMDDDGGIRTLDALQVVSARPDSPIRDPDLGRAELNAQFQQPDGDNAPGSVLGVFQLDTGSNFLRTPGGYEITGAFGAERQ